MRRGASIPTTITSLQNERVKLIRSLEMRKARRETGLFVAEGASLLVMARDHGHAPEILVRLAGAADGITRLLSDWVERAGGVILDVSQPVMEKLAAKDNPQTVMGVFRQRWGEAPEPSKVRECETWLALEEVRDPGNLGTIVRTAHAVGVSGVLLVGTCCDPFQRECVRATMGSIFAVPLARLGSAALPSFAGRWRGDVVGLHLDAREDFRRVAYRDPVLLVMGSEGPGLSPAAKAVCTRLVRIPMAGDLDSLNLAVATALALYEVRGRHLIL